MKGGGGSLLPELSVLACLPTWLLKCLIPTNVLLFLLSCIGSLMSSSHVFPFFG